MPALASESLRPEQNEAVRFVLGSGDRVVSISGAAGTGKTESVKALGSQLGRFVLVFCCDDSFDLKAVSHIFVGLCMCGAVFFMFRGLPTESRQLPQQFAAQSTTTAGDTASATKLDTARPE